MKYWQTPHFKALQRAWYTELAHDGFEDAEEMIAGEMVLRQIAAHPYRGSDPIGVENKQSYFLTMTQKAHESVFHSDVDRLIVTMFVEGAKINTIVKALAKNGKARCRGTVRYVIRKYEMEWGLREYTPKQLNKKLRTA